MRRIAVLALLVPLIVSGCGMFESNELDEDQCRWLAERQFTFQRTLLDRLKEDLIYENLTPEETRDRRRSIREIEPELESWIRDEFFECLDEGRVRYSETDLWYLRRYGP